MRVLFLCRRPISSDGKGWCVCVWTRAHFIKSARRVSFMLLSLMIVFEVSWEESGGREAKSYPTVRRSLSKCLDFRDARVGLSKGPNFMSHLSEVYSNLLSAIRQKCQYFFVVREIEHFNIILKNCTNSRTNVLYLEVSKYWKKLINCKSNQYVFIYLYNLYTVLSLT